MRLLQASKCCFCANLRTGGLIIGYLYLILAILHAPAIGKGGIITFGMCGLLLFIKDLPSGAEKTEIDYFSF